MTIQLSTRDFPEYATRYYGDDVQRFWFEREGDEYRIMQRPHWGNVRCAARTWASNVKAAKIEFFAYARESA